MADTAYHETHEIKRTVRFSHTELERAIGREAARVMGLTERYLDKKNVALKVLFEEETAGSPAYRVGTKATVTLIEDCPPQAEAENPHAD